MKTTNIYSPLTNTELNILWLYISKAVAELYHAGADEPIKTEIGTIFWDISTAINNRAPTNSSPT